MVNPKISIIVPVYNTEIYLKECIDSILNQTLEEIEVIFINDGSTDNSVEVIKENMKKNIFTIIEQENSGVGITRNKGIKVATGEYILFLDSDDYLDKHACERMYKIAKDTESDVVQCGLKFFYEDGQDDKLVKYNQNKNICTYSSLDSVKRYLKYDIRGYSCNRICKRELLIKNEILYPVGVCYEDMYITLRVLDLAKKVTLVNECLYNYRQRKDSLSKEIKDKSIRDYISQVKICVEYVDKYKAVCNMTDYIESFRVMNYLNAVNWYIKLYKCNIKNILKNYNDFFSGIDYKINIKMVLMLKNLSRNYKIIYLLWKLKIYHLFIKFNII